jgi:hypothetical protein
VPQSPGISVVTADCGCVDGANPPSVSVQISPESHIMAPSSSSVMERPTVVQISPEIQIPASSSSVMERPTVDQITPEFQIPASSSPSVLVRANVDGSPSSARLS